MKNSIRFLKIMLAAVLVLIVLTMQSKAQTTLWTESFENGGSIPAGWATDVVTAGNSITYVTTTSWPAGFTAYNGTYLVMFNSFSASGGVMRLRKTAPVSTVGYTNATVDFAWLESSGYAGVLDRVDVQYSTNGTTWTTAGTFNRYNAVQGWKIKTQVLPAGAQGQATLYIAFLFTSAYGNDCYLDLAHLTATSSSTTVTVGTGTVSCNYPYTTYWMGGRTQLLYTAAQLTAAGALPGTISSIAFNVISNSTQTMQNFNINMMNTTQTTIASWVTGMTNAYSGTYAVGGTGWQTITLQTPFNWNGQNLLLEICFGSNGSYTSYSYVNGTTAPAGQIMPYWMDNTVGCTYTGAPYTGYTALPNLQFVEQPIIPGTLSGTVTNSVTSAAIAGATVTVTGTTPVTTNAAGAYSITGITPATVNVTCTATGYVPYAGTAVITSGTTTTLNIAMLPNPKLGGTVTDASTGAPIIGASVKVAGVIQAWTVTGGVYLTSPLPVAGLQPVVISKTGYDDFTTNVTLVGGQT
ncbi:MAG: carboxypeptidase regulatory-like domain-containing protein, partial [Bacteroidota bacterium]